LAAIAGLPRTITEYVRDHVYVTPSGMLSDTYLQEAIRIVGIDRIMFATDYPFEPASHDGARAYLRSAPLTDIERHKIGSGNWERLRSQIRR
jgi:predicted TIM-barrel fold metal-dependent hydrolase